MAKHYITIDEDKNVIKAFTDKFGKPQITDICVNENAGRHWHIDLLKDGLYKYKYDDSKNEIVEKTHSEIYTAEVVGKILSDKKQEKLNQKKQEMLTRLLDEDINIVKTEFATKKQEIENATTIVQLDEL